MRAFQSIIIVIMITLTGLSVAAQDNNQKQDSPKSEQLPKQTTESKQQNTDESKSSSTDTNKNEKSDSDDADDKQADNNQPDESKPPLKPEDLKVVVIQLKNKVAYRENPKAKWKTCKPGMVIPHSSDISTGLRSSVKLQVGPNITIDLGSLTIATIARLSFDKSRVLKTDVYKKYGELKFDVKRTTEFQNDLKIHTPGAVTAVKGTGGLHQSFGAQSRIINFNGTFSVATPYGPEIPFTPGDSGSNNQSYQQQYKQNQQQAQYGAAPNQNTRSPSSAVGSDKTLTGLYNGWDAWRTTMMEFEEKRKGKGDGGQNAYIPKRPPVSYTPPRQVD